MRQIAPLFFTSQGRTARGVAPSGAALGGEAEKRVDS